MERIGLKGTKVFGIANIITGLITSSLAVPFFTVLGAVWFLNESPAIFSFPLFLNYLQRLLCVIWYLSFVGLFISGIMVLRKNTNSVRFTLGVGLLMLFCSSVNFLIGLTNEIFKFGESITEIIRRIPYVYFTFDQNWFYYASWVYAILIIFYFTRPQVKEQFK